MVARAHNSARQGMTSHLRAASELCGAGASTEVRNRAGTPPLVNMDRDGLLPVL